MNRTPIYVVITILTMLLGYTVAKAHSWYPMRCCHEIDCGPAENVEYLPGGDMRITAKVHGGMNSVVVPKGFKREPSQDENFHICMTPDHTPLCLFVPGGA